MLDRLDTDNFEELLAFSQFLHLLAYELLYEEIVHIIRLNRSDNYIVSLLRFFDWCGIDLFYFLLGLILQSRLFTPLHFFN
jgi:hypothetical protein